MNVTIGNKIEEKMKTDAYLQQLDSVSGASLT